MRHELLLWLKQRLRFVLPIAVIIGCAPAYVRAYEITPGGISEVPTILPGDIVVVNTAAYDLRLPYTTLKLFRLSTPRRGEMVLILNPTSDWPAPKRVVAIPGDIVEVRENRVFINGRPSEARALNRSDFAWVPQSAKPGSLIENEDGHWISYTPEKGRHRNSPPIRLASNQYFLLGDNRDESADSREWGPLGGDSIRGIVLMVLHIGKRT